MKINFPQTHIDWIANATKIHKPSINYLEKNGTHKMFWFEFRLCYRPLTRPINSAHVNAATNMCGKVFCWCFVIYVRLHLSVNICSPISVLKKTITLNAIENNICAIHNWNTWFIRELWSLHAIQYNVIIKKYSVAENIVRIVRILLWLSSTDKRKTPHDIYVYTHIVRSIFININYKPRLCVWVFV